MYPGPESNADNDTNFCDADFGTCKYCGGDPKAKTLCAKMGENTTMFYDARIDILLGNGKGAFSAEDKKTFRGWGYAKKCRYIAKLIQGGKMI